MSIMRKMLMLENTKGEESIIHRVTLESVRLALNNVGIPLQSVDVNSTSDSPFYGSPGEDTIYCGNTTQNGHEWEVCLRSVYVPPLQGASYFGETLKRIVDNFKPDCILLHLALYGRGDRFYDYPAIKYLLPYTQKKIRVVVYTGSSNEEESLIADTDGRIGYRYNGRNIESQINIILNLLRE